MTGRSRRRRFPVTFRRVTVSLDLDRLRPEPFVPVAGVAGPHAQTLLARFLRPSSGVPFRRRRLETPDGDFVDLDFAYPDRAGMRDDVLVLLLHGLEGSARSRYALELYRNLATHGVPAVGFNFRSCSGELNRSTRLYHSGETGDLRFVLHTLRNEFPQRRIGVAGFSLGGNVMLKYLAECGESGEESGVAAAVSVSVPFDLAAGSRHLERPSGRVYVSFLLGKLRRKTAAKRAILADRIDVDRAVRARTFYEFDDVATAPLHGFAGADDYYRQSSSGPRVGSVRVPTLMIQAEDDPFLPSAAIPREAAGRNPCVLTAFSPSGGHVGFLGGRPWRPHFWAERTAATFLVRALD